MSVIVLVTSFKLTIHDKKLNSCKNSSSEMREYNQQTIDVIFPYVITKMLMFSTPQSTKGHVIIAILLLVCEQMCPAAY